MDGVGLGDVQKLMGHRTIAMTCRYVHLAPKHLLDAVRRLDGWGSARTGTKTGTGSKRLQRSARLTAGNRLCNNELR